MNLFTALPDRAVIALSGDDRVSFLQGLTSNDVTLAAPGHAVWSALLTPQGRWVADFFILSDGDRLLLDCEREQAAMIIQKLSRFKLRAKVTLALTDRHAGVAWGGAPPAGVLSAPDPRLPEAGWRLLSEGPIEGNADVAAWHTHRIGLGLPDGTRDLEPDRTLLLEAGFDELNGVSWSKGCYMGQELTARTRYRGLVKRRLLPVHGVGPLHPGKIFDGDAEVGEIRSVAGTHGLAFVRLGHLTGGLTSGGQSVTVETPDWVKLKQAS